MKFVIVCNRQFWGGTIVAHYLCKLLEESGYKTRIIRVTGSGHVSINNSRGLFFLYCFYKELLDLLGNLKTHLFPNSPFGMRHYSGYIHLPVKGTKRLYFPYVNDDTVVIYMDVTRGNPLHAKNVVRWMCYYNRWPNDDTWYSRDDLFFTYREQFNDYKLNPNCNILKIFNFDNDLYKRTNFGPRHGNCYIVRKGSGRKDLPSHFDGPVIDNLREPDKVKVLNQCERCYIYDTQTFYTAIAALCGCIPIVVLEPGKTKEDYVKSDDEVYGVAYGDSPDEIEFAVRTRAEVQRQIDKMLAENGPMVDSFIEKCKDYFKL